MGEGASNNENHRHAPSGTPLPIPADTLGLALAGELPCLNCAYELKGLTIRGNCPECGLPIRVTIMYAVDPDNEAFGPIKRPKLVAAGLIVLVSGYTFVPLLITIRIISSFTTPWTGVFGQSLDSALSLMWQPMMLVLILAQISTTILVSGLKQIRDIALIAASWLPLLAACFVFFGLAVSDFYSGTSWNVRFLELGFAGSLLCLLLPIRSLTRRSALLRTGRVPRQHTLALAIALVIAVASGLIRELVAADTPIASIAIALQVVGWALATLGMLGLTRDASIAAKTIRRPPKRLAELLAKPDTAART